jgi:hypothetical protein
MIGEHRRNIENSVVANVGQKSRQTGVVYNEIPSGNLT